eukprot:1904392-Rhodomonas_salina.1
MRLLPGNLPHAPPHRGMSRCAAASSPLPVKCRRHASCTNAGCGTLPHTLTSFCPSPSENKTSPRALPLSSSHDRC